MTHPTISIDRAARKFAVFDNHIDLVYPFTRYTDEKEALMMAREWVAGRTSIEPVVVYPRVTKMRMS